MIYQHIGRYKIIKEIGHGGMGKIFEVYDPVLCRRVALKIRKNTFQDKTLFVKEAQNTARLCHPNIITVYEVGQDGDQVYFTMPIIKGESLSQLLEKHIITIQQGIRILIKIAEAVAYSHSKGVIHRDIKPSNIIIQQDQVPKLMDFGLSKEIYHLNYSCANTAGTPAYMAPEQLQGQIDFQSDIYSLGAILYEILTQHPPFSSDTSVQIFTQVLEKEPQSPMQLNPKIDKQIDAICRKAMAKSLKIRYHNAQDFANDLQNYLTGNTIASCNHFINKRTLHWMLFFIYIAIIITISSFLIASPKRVMIVFSYNKKLAWNQSIKKTIQKHFSEYFLNMDKEVAIREEYLATDTENQNRYHNIKKAIIHIKNWKPNVVITVDDDATEAMISHFANTPIQFVFCGVNKALDKIPKNVTGIYESMFIRETWDTLKIFLPKAQRCIILLEKTQLVSILDTHIKNQIPDYKSHYILKSSNWDEWKSFLKKYEKQSDFIYMPTYHNLKDHQGITVEASTVMPWVIENMSIPPIGLLDFNIVQGALLGVVDTAELQGEKAASYSIDILKNYNQTNNLPVYQIEHGKLYINLTTAKRYNISIPDDILENAITIP